MGEIAIHLDVKKFRLSNPQWNIFFLSIAEKNTLFLMFLCVCVCVCAYSEFFSETTQ